MQIIFLIAIILWFWMGDPQKNIADWIWTNEAAPWEEVDAFYYPNRNDLSDFELHIGLKTVEACRDWVRRTAATHGDAGIVRGDYECGVERLGDFGDMRVYRLTVK
jgi:hypothetical protein